MLHAKKIVIYYFLDEILIKKRIGGTFFIYCSYTCSETWLLLIYKYVHNKFWHWLLPILLISCDFPWRANSETAFHNELSSIGDGLKLSFSRKIILVFDDDFVVVLGDSKLIAVHSLFPWLGFSESAKKGKMN